MSLANHVNSAKDATIDLLVWTAVHFEGLDRPAPETPLYPDIQHGPWFDLPADYHRPEYLLAYTLALVVAIILAFVFTRPWSCF